MILNGNMHTSGSLLTSIIDESTFGTNNGFIFSKVWNILLNGTEGPNLSQWSKLAFHPCDFTLYTQQVNIYRNKSRNKSTFTVQATRQHLSFQTTLRASSCVVLCVPLIELVGRIAALNHWPRTERMWCWRTFTTANLLPWTSTANRRPRRHHHIQLPCWFFHDTNECLYIHCANAFAAFNWRHVHHHLQVFRWEPHLE